MIIPANFTNKKIITINIFLVIVLLVSFTILFISKKSVTKIANIITTPIGAVISPSGLLAIPCVKLNAIFRKLGKRKEEKNAYIIQSINFKKIECVKVFL